MPLWRMASSEISFTTSACAPIGQDSNIVLVDQTRPSFTIDGCTTLDVSGDGHLCLSRLDE